MTDKTLQHEVLAELEFEPQVKPERIGVSAQNGVITLSGTVETYPQKLAAERAARRVYSAKAVVNELEVRLTTRDEVPDSELAEAAVQAVETLSTIPPDTVRITVRHGHVALEGIVDWQYQRETVEQAVQHLRGVRRVENHLQVRERASLADVRHLIADALRRSAEVEAKQIAIESLDGMVILRGYVRSLREKEEAERAAWRAPGVNEVENRLVIQT